jgi:hypothetical protein
MFLKLFSRIGFQFILGLLGIKPWTAKDAAKGTAIPGKAEGLKANSAK